LSATASRAADRYPRQALATALTQLNIDSALVQDAGIRAEPAT
jgi:hypothetical protein